jgi:hypothetical protein
MKLQFSGSTVECDGGQLDLSIAIKEAIQIGERVLVIHDYMAFPENQPAPNLVAYNTSGERLWTAQNLTTGSATDAYTEFMSEYPLWVGNFEGFNCRIDLETGKLLKSIFTK